MDTPHGGTQRRPDGLGGAGASDALPPASKGPDRSRRDEWSEGGVLSLLEVYESKWLLRNRAKLKWSDWEDIAHLVSVRCSGTKAVKTPNQCKNKIESMKKRYRAESAAAQHSNSCSSWQFYTRMDGLLKGTAGCYSRPKAENEATEVQALPPKVVVDLELEGNMQDSNQDDGSNTLPNNVVVNNANNGNNELKENRGLGSDLSTPRSKVAANAGEAAEEYVNPFKRKKGFGSEVAESIRFLAHSILKIEQVRMEMYKDTERMRVEAEIKRGEMELKRTEIIANTQLQIAKLLSRGSKGKNVKCEDSSLRFNKQADVECQPS
ncbi:hypothetical protein Taro_003663 [Colocasia esculenta]|uniref:Myb/SANT-like DNA-binding domain-containing protein n=1 Tax=Colocasia esculenta TaxID=4460 RepID=A0A843TM98_COLES|nr:hypothetical protein [Colocasia esculenta]